MALVPRLCFLGPFIGRNKGQVTTQDQVLSDLFAQAGYPTLTASDSMRRLVRLFEIIQTIIKNRHAIDIVCLSIYGGRSFVVEDIASFLAKAFKLPIIMTLHGGDMPKFMARFPNWAQRVLKRATCITAPSHYLVEAVTRVGFQARLIPNVIEISQYPFRQRTQVQPRLFWMRSFHDIYHPSMAVDVLHELQLSLPNASMVMAGSDKGLQDQVIRYAASIGMDSKISFPGFLNMRQKVEYAEKSDIFVNTSRTDNMPVALVEAAALGLPIVSTAVGGIPYLITQNQTGLLVPDGNVAEMVASIQQLVSNPSLASKLSAQGRELAEKSSWERVRQRWDEMFSQLLTARYRT